MMRMKKLSYKIKAALFAALICLCLSVFPGTAFAAQAAFGGVFGKIEQSDFYIWEEAKALAGYKPDASGIPEDPKFYGGSQDPTLPRTYYGRLLGQGVNETEAQRRTEAWYSKVGNAMDAYKTAVAAGSGAMQQVENGRYTTYTVTSADQIAGFKRQAEALVALHATLKEAGANTSEDDIMLQDAQKTLADIASGKLTVGSTHQAHEAGNLEGSADLGSKRYDANGNLISETRVATPIFCLERHGGDVFPDLDLQGCVGLGLYYGLLKPSSWVLWAAGVAFNYSIDFTLNFGKFIRDQGLGKSGSGAIYLGWSAIRDLINVGFIFILLYAAISTIVGLDGYGVKKTVVKVVIAALLLNFSLFFTKALIDMSNLIALQFYTRVLTAADQANGSSDALTRGDSKGDDWDSGLSIGFVNALGLKSIWGGSIRTSNSAGAGEATSAFGNINASQLIIICLGGSAFILVTAFTLFMATLRFLYRSIVLIFLMILSPIGFVGGAIPALKGAAGKWQSRLKNNLIFAPAYMAIFYVVALIVFTKDIGPSQVDANSGAGLTGFGALFQGHVSSTGLLFWFIMIIGLMMGTQIAADQFADKLGMADSFKKKAKGWASGFGKSAAGGFGSAGYVGRRVVGNTGTALSQNKLVQGILTRGPLKNIGGQKLYNKLGDLKDKKVGGYSLSDAKKAREARDEKTRDRLSEVRKPRSNESQADFSFRKDMEELEAYKKHLDQLGIAYTTQGQDLALKKAGKIVVGRTYTQGDDAANRKAEKDEFDRAEFEAKKIGGVVGASMLAAIKKARTGNKGSVKGIDDQIKELAKKRDSIEDASFKIIRDNYTREKEAAELALATATATSGPGSAAELAAAITLQAKILRLNKHTKNLDDTIRRIEQLEKDLAIANSRSSS